MVGERLPPNESARPLSRKGLVEEVDDIEVAPERLLAMRLGAEVGALFIFYAIRYKLS